MNKGSGILRTFRTEKLPTPLQLDYHFSVVLDGLLNQISLNGSFFRNYYGISSNLGPEKHWKTFYTEKFFRKIGSDRFSHLQKTFQIRRKLFRFGENFLDSEKTFQIFQDRQVKKFFKYPVVTVRKNLIQSIG